jgi:hypothetical protein
MAIRLGSDSKYNAKYTEDAHGFFDDPSVILYCHSALLLQKLLEYADLDAVLLE